MKGVVTSMKENNKIEEFLLPYMDDTNGILYDLTVHTTREILDAYLTEDKILELLRKDFKGEHPNVEMKHYRKYLDDLGIKHELTRSPVEKLYVEVSQTLLGRIVANIYWREEIHIIPYCEDAMDIARYIKRAYYDMKEYQIFIDMQGMGAVVGDCLYELGVPHQPLKRRTLPVLDLK